MQTVSYQDIEQAEQSDIGKRAGEMDIKDLWNPRQVKGLVLKKHNIVVGENQGFQERPGSWELWQMMETGLLMRVQRWLKTSVIATLEARADSFQKI